MPRTRAGSAPPSTRSEAVTRRAATLAGVSSVADVAAVAQLVTTGSGAGVLVAGRDLRPGSWACARTAEGNVVAVQVAGPFGEDGELSISYTVWHK